MSVKRSPDGASREHIKVVPPLKACFETVLAPSAAKLTFKSMSPGKTSSEPRSSILHPGGSREISEIMKTSSIFPEFIKIIAGTGSFELLKDYFSIITRRLMRANWFEVIYIGQDLCIFKDIFRIALNKLLKE
jgi:hypothetical protein